MKLKTKLNLFFLSEGLIFFHLFGGVLIPFYTLWAGLSITQVMLLQAWFSFCILVLEIPTGTLADLIGRKRTILLGVAINIVAVLLYGLFQNFWVFLIAEVCWAAAFALFSGAKEAMIYDTLVDHKAEKQSKRIFGRFKMSHLIGLMIAAPIGSYIGEHYGVHWPMLLMVIPLLLSACVLSFVPEPKSHKPLPEESDETIDQLSAKGEEARPTFWQQIKSGWKYFHEHPFLRILAFDMVGIWTLAFMIVWFYQIVLEDLLIPIQYYGWFATFALLAQIVVLTVYPHLERWLGSKKHVLTLTGILPGIGFLLLGLFPSVPMVFISIACCSGFGLTRRALYASYMNKFISSELRATVNSFINIWLSIGGVIIKPLFGFVADLNIGVALVGLGIGCLLITLFSRVEEKMLVD